MSLDELSFDLDSNISENSAEKISEVSEKFKESIKRASAWIAKTQKDDFLLASFLVKIIIDKKYDSLLENIFKVIDFWYSSNFVLWILSLINIEISHKIRELSKKQEISFNFISEENIEFNDNNINKNIKNRINFWIEDLIDILSIEFSNIQNKRNIDLLEKDNKIIVLFTAQIFSFFLKGVNISIQKEKAISISNFIISEVKQNIKKLQIEEI